MNAGRNPTTWRRVSPTSRSQLADHLPRHRGRVGHPRFPGAGGQSIPRRACRRRLGRRSRAAGAPRRRRRLPRAAEAAGASAASTFVAWITTWDDDTDAEDFAAEAALALGDLARVAVLDARPASGRLRLTDADGRLFAVERRRRTVGLLLAAPADAENFLAGLLDCRATAARPASPGRRPARRPPLEIGRGGRPGSPPTRGRSAPQFGRRDQRGPKSAEQCGAADTS